MPPVSAERDPSFLHTVTDAVRDNSRALAFAGAFGLAVVAAACGGGEESRPTATASQPPEATAPPASAQSNATGGNREPVKVTFDDLGGGDPVIHVYPGVSTANEDRQKNGVYEDGKTAPADCKLKGRPVTSRVDLGEEDRNSDDWIRLFTSGSTEGPNPQVKRQHATVVYIEDPAAVLSQLDTCKS